MNKIFFKKIGVKKCWPPFPYKRTFLKIMNFYTKELGIKNPAELNIIFVNNKKMREISKKYRNKDVSTDVLSFKNNYEYLKKFLNYLMLGDIYISYEKVIEYACDKKNIKQELLAVFTHGLLHLLGFDHKEEKEKQEMIRWSQKVKIGGRTISDIMWKKWEQ